MGGWMDGVVRVGVGRETDVDGLRGHNGTVCFERAVVMRRGGGGDGGEEEEEGGCLGC